MKVRYNVLAVFLFSGILLHAQRDTLGRYSPGFKFTDGVYLEFEEFKMNCPGILIKDLRDEDGHVLDPLKNTGAWYRVDNDTTVRVDKSSIWGFSGQGQVYVRNQDFFDRLVVIGTLCHLIQREEYLDHSATFQNGYGSLPVRREVRVEFFIDVRTGEKKVFAETEFAPHLADDPLLLGSFERMNKKQRKLSMYRMLHSYNEKHPVYFPISKCRR